MSMNIFHQHQNYTDKEAVEERMYTLRRQTTSTQVSYPQGTLEELLVELAHSEKGFKELVHTFRFRKLGVLPKVVLNQFPQRL